MDKNRLWQFYFLSSIFLIVLSGCSSEIEQPTASPDNYSGLPLYHGEAPYSAAFNEQKFASLVPQNIKTKEKVILVDPKVYAWGAYDETGKLIRAGMASAGADYCPDEGQPCRTNTGKFRIHRLGDETCVSHTYPIGNPGSLMPYCMFFNGGQSLHGTPDQMLVEANISHGCVHMRIPDAEWLRNNFADVGTRVVVLPYD